MSDAAPYDSYAVQQIHKLNTRTCAHMQIGMNTSNFEGTDLQAVNAD